MDKFNKVSQLFEQFFHLVPETVSHAPGRVNLIGDHTDYNDGFVLPAAINFVTKVAASKRLDKQVRVIACDIGFEEVSFNIEAIEFDYEHTWSNYVRGVLKVLIENYPSISGVNLLISGNVPKGAGLSSSASFEIAVIKAIAQLYDLEIDGIKAALFGQKAENDFVGCNCGIMDQLISAMGMANHGMLLDCRSLTFKNAPIPESHSVLVVNSNVKRGLVDSEYNLRREQCEAVATYFDRKALRDISLLELEQVKEELDSTLYRRAHHVISENQRTQAFYEYLLNNDISSVAELMRQSHLSLKHDFEVTTPELDFLAEILNEQLGNQGGARMTGGGFGGCVVALVPSHLVSELSAHIAECYFQQFTLKADSYRCSVVNGSYVKC